MKIMSIMCNEYINIPSASMVKKVVSANHGPLEIVPGLGVKVGSGRAAVVIPFSNILSLEIDEESAPLLPSETSQPKQEGVKHEKPKHSRK